MFNVYIVCFIKFGAKDCLWRLRGKLNSQFVVINTRHITNTILTPFQDHILLWPDHAKNVLAYILLYRYNTFIPPPPIM